MSMLDRDYTAAPGSVGRAAVRVIVISAEDVDACTGHIRDPSGLHGSGTAFRQTIAIPGSESPSINKCSECARQNARQQHYIKIEDTNNPPICHNFRPAEEI